jgi:GDP-D-mannose dehydratase
MTHMSPERRYQVYNLGAQSHVKVSIDMPEFTAVGAIEWSETGCRTAW